MFRSAIATLLLVSIAFVAPVSAQPTADGAAAYRELERSMQAEREAMRHFESARAALDAAQAPAEGEAAGQVGRAEALVAQLAANAAAIEAAFVQLAEASKPRRDVLLELDVLEAWYENLLPAAAYLTERSFAGAAHELEALAAAGLLEQGDWRFPTLASVRNRLAELHGLLGSDAAAREQRRAGIRAGLDRLADERSAIVSALGAPVALPAASDDPWMEAALTFEEASRELGEAREAVRAALDRVAAANAQLGPPILREVAARSAGALLYQAKWTLPDGGSPDELARQVKRKTLREARDTIGLSLDEVRILRRAGNGVRLEIAEIFALRGKHYYEWSQRLRDDLMWQAWVNAGFDLGLTAAEIVLTGGVATLARKSEELALETAAARIAAAKEVKIAIAGEAEELLAGQAFPYAASIEKSLVEHLVRENEGIEQGLRRASTLGVDLLRNQMAGRVDELVGKGIDRELAAVWAREEFQPAISRLLDVPHYARLTEAGAAPNPAVATARDWMPGVATPDREALIRALEDKYLPKVPVAVGTLGAFMAGVVDDPGAAVVAPSDTASGVVLGDAIETGLSLLISNYKATPALAGAEALGKWASFKNAAFGTVSVKQSWRTIKAQRVSLGIGVASTLLKTWVAHQTDVVVERDAAIMAELWTELVVRNAIYQREMQEDRALAAIETQLERARAAVSAALAELDSAPPVLAAAPLEPTSLWLPVEFDLTFSVGLTAPPRVSVAGKAATVVRTYEDNMQYWKAVLPLGDVVPGLQVLSVELDGAATPYGSLDADPATPAVKRPGLRDWFGFETGADTTHRFETAVTRYEPVPPVFPVTAPEGNWVATYHDYPPGGTTAGHHTIHVAWNTTCTEDWKVGCIWRTVRADPPALNSGAFYNFSAGEEIVRNGNQVDFRWGYGHLGYWGSTGSLTIGQDRMAGQWKTRDSDGFGGTAEWVRETARLTHVVVTAGEIVSSTAAGQPAPVELSYSAQGWGAGNDMPGNRPEVAVTLLGEQMWGHHMLEFRDVPGLQIRDVYAVWPEGQERTAATMEGITFNLMVWPGLSPGLKTLWFNGQPVELDVRIKNYPGEKG